MIYFQVHRYFAIATQLFSRYEDEIVQGWESKMATINDEIIQRLRLPDIGRIPWNTQLVDKELDQYYRLWDWVDAVADKEMPRLPLATVASVNIMLSNLRDRLRGGRLSLVQLEFYRGTCQIHDLLVTKGIKDGLANTEKGTLFPFESDSQLAEFFDKMHDLGICLDT